MKLRLPEPIRGFNTNVTSSTAPCDHLETLGFSAGEHGETGPTVRSLAAENRRPGTSRLRHGARRASLLFSQGVLQPFPVEGQICDEPLELAVLILELLEPSYLCHAPSGIVRSSGNRFTGPIRGQGYQPSAMFRSLRWAAPRVAGRAERKKQGAEAPCLVPGIGLLLRDRRQRCSGYLSSSPPLW